MKKRTRHSAEQIVQAIVASASRRGIESVGSLPVLIEELKRQMATTA